MNVIRIWHQSLEVSYCMLLRRTLEPLTKRHIWESTWLVTPTKGGQVLVALNSLLRYAVYLLRENGNGEDG
jgi:hypothetical protein